MNAPRRARHPDPFKALADATRRGILELLRKRRVCSAGEIAARFPRISRPAVSRHLRVLRQARLVRARGIGREHLYELEPAALAQMHREWLALFTSTWDASLAALKKQVESKGDRGRK